MKTTSNLLDFFVKNFSELFAHEILGIPERAHCAGAHILFFGACDLLSQMVARHYVKDFKGFITRYTTPEAFGNVFQEAIRVSIDGRMRLVLISNAHKIPVQHIKMLCFCPRVWIVATRMPVGALPGFFI